MISRLLICFEVEILDGRKTLKDTERASRLDDRDSSGRAYRRTGHEDWFATATAWRLFGSGALPVGRYPVRSRQSTQAPGRGATQWAWRYGWVGCGNGPSIALSADLDGSARAAFDDQGSP